MQETRRLTQLNGGETRERSHTVRPNEKAIICLFCFRPISGRGTGRRYVLGEVRNLAVDREKARKAESGIGRDYYF